MNDRLRSKLDDLPSCPGVYTFKDRLGKIIYVGKAKSLRSRVRSYFGEGEPTSPRAAALIRRIRDIDFIATKSEVEALILECNLIKHFRPRYNVNLKDDKKYPYIKVTTREPFPSVFPTRNLVSDGSRYFGPYTDAKAMRRSLKVLTSIFPVRTCRKHLPLKQPERGCLNFHIGKCIGPCRGDIPREAYRRLVDQVCQYLAGKMSKLIHSLRRRMDRAARDLRFEEAARLRDTIKALEKVSERQTVVMTSPRDRDVLAVRSGKRLAIGYVLKIREGKLVGKEVYRLSFEGQPTDDEILNSFLRQYIAATAPLPDEILLEAMPSDIDLIRTWLEARAGRKVRVYSPRSGKAHDLVVMAGNNAQLGLNQITERVAQEGRIPRSLTELMRWLHLAELPRLIEAFDISATQGSLAVGSRVAFKDARPYRKLYRHYTIRDVIGQDDFAMMREVAARAWSHISKDEEEKPQLILIDGGKGQVTSAIQGIKDAGASDADLPPIVGIAKRLDEIWFPDRSAPLQIPHDSPALRLLQRIRDEAHRFAIDFHRKRRRKAAIRSQLEQVPGIGGQLAKRLLEQFGSVDRIRQVTIDELCKVRGISRSKAQTIHNYLTRGV